MGRFSLLSACPRESRAAWNHQRRIRAHERPACQIADWPHGLFGRIRVRRRRLRGTLLAAVALEARSIAAPVVSEPRPIASTIATLEAALEDPRLPRPPFAVRVETLSEALVGVGIVGDS